MNVFVVDTNKKPLNPVHAARARKLLSTGQAAVLRRFPFTIVLKYAVAGPKLRPLRIKLDPGSRTTGIALLHDASGEVVFAAELTHRGMAIKDRLQGRKRVRRGRRQRHTRYRAARWRNRRRPKGWLPSLHSRVNNVVVWVQRFMRLCPITAISMELVRFEGGSGGRTAYNRTQRGLPKTHWCDAACIGASTPSSLKVGQVVPLSITAMGRQRRQMCLVDKHGFPRSKAKQASRKYAFRIGDIVRAVVPAHLKHAGVHVGRMSSKASGALTITTANGPVTDIGYRYCTRLQRADGYAYVLKGGRGFHPFP